VAGAPLPLLGGCVRGAAAELTAAPELSGKARGGGSSFCTARGESRDGEWPEPPTRGPRGDARGGEVRGDRPCREAVMLGGGAACMKCGL